MFVDVLPIAERLRPAGVRIIVAHAERYPELLDDPALAAQLDQGGMPDSGDGPGTRGAVGHGGGTGAPAVGKGGFVHLMGSDGHGIDRRRPVLAAGFERLR